ncbi:hypothetical protein [Robertkochia solimangrovi]|uniref:hypothetical protein n=1 Tax=Robertkochia solimangrovi TaxID=2213046 RepID=UPI00117FFF64|nr:hypothetical protein [Robertkochia solimangrovi]TRZ41699.1 hypothetical protein DMZ48_16835 [Robertkochia solimangrovi]
MKTKRPRIKRHKEVAVKDPLEFVPNCASENARKIHVYKEFEIELWIDKHYHDRKVHGDENGKREGIEENDVSSLIIDSFKYLLEIYLRGSKFKFINFFDPSKPGQAKERIVLKRFLDDGVLNVVVEVNYIDTSKYEITVITAMQTIEDNFRISDGQYSLCLSTDSINLNRMVNKSNNSIYKL